MLDIRKNQALMLIKVNKVFYYLNVSFLSLFASIWVNKLKNEQLQDEFTGEILRYLENGELPTCDRKARQILLTADRYIVNNDVLYRIYDENQSTKHRQIDEMRLCLCLPKSLIPIAVQEIHNQNHQGVYRTYLATKLKYWFPSLYEITKRYVLSCETSCEIYS